MFFFEATAEASVFLWDYSRGQCFSLGLQQRPVFFFETTPDDKIFFFVNAEDRVLVKSQKQPVFSLITKIHTQDVSEIKFENAKWGYMSYSPTRIDDLSDFRSTPRRRTRTMRIVERWARAGPSLESTSLSSLLGNGACIRAPSEKQAALCFILTYLLRSYPYEDYFDTS